MLEYVVLGDFQTAVGFLLASTPEKSARYYRDALCTLALAVRQWLHVTASWRFSKSKSSPLCAWDALWHSTTACQ